MYGYKAHKYITVAYFVAELKAHPTSIRAQLKSQLMGFRVELEAYFLRFRSQILRLVVWICVSLV